MSTNENDGEEEPVEPAGCLSCSSDALRQRMLNAFAEKGIRVEALDSVTAASSPDVIVCPVCGQAWVVMPAQGDLKS